MNSNEILERVSTVVQNVVAAQIVGNVINRIKNRWNKTVLNPASKWYYKTIYGKTKFILSFVILMAVLRFYALTWRMGLRGGKESREKLMMGVALLLLVGACLLIFQTW